MGLLQRRCKGVVPLNMTLTTSYISDNNACINVGSPLSGGTTTVLPCRYQKNSCVHYNQYCICRLAQTAPSLVLISPLSVQYNADLKILNDTVRALRLSDWYYEGPLDWQGAQVMLKEASVGAFIVRNSSDKNFLFSLSIQTEKGPTSVRLHYDGGYFRLDCDKSLAKYMPRFRGVIELVQHYIREGSRQLQRDTVWIDLVGSTHSRALLKHPIRKKPPSLQHWARLAIHKVIDSNPLTPKLWTAPKHRLLPLPNSLLDYLNEYPYSV